MGVLGGFFGCSGVVGFIGRCLGVSIGDGGFMLVCISGCRGVVGFNVAMSQLSVREKVRPARLVEPLQGEFCTGLVGERVCWANFVAYTGTVAGYHR